jgi:hypothetical protein
VSSYRPAVPRRSASPPGIAFAAVASPAAANMLGEAFGWVALGAQLTVPGNEPQGLSQISPCGLIVFKGTLLLTRLSSSMDAIGR